MTMRKVILIIGILLNTICYAQNYISLDVPSITPVSPGAAAMEKYQFYPVDYSTGIPDITIPLYEIKVGEVVLPITLSYHASGLKPKEEAGRAGTGWTLNIEPSVMRQIRGIADDSGSGWFSKSPVYFWNDLEEMNYYDQIATYKRDGQPDKFTYKLANGGGSGCFINRAHFLTIPRNDDKIEFDGGNIQITDPKGIAYYFNDVYDKTGDYITRWLCTSIHSPHDENSPLISFEYNRSLKMMNPSNYYNLNDRVTINFKGHDKKTILTEQSAYGDNHYEITEDPWASQGEASLRSIDKSEAGVNYPSISRHSTDDMTYSLLSQINFKGNKMLISYKASGDNDRNRSSMPAINEIEIRDEDEMLIRSIKFFITPYNKNSSLTKLDSVRISVPRAETRTYSFLYNSSFAVPSIYTEAVDHWGFCNGEEGDSHSNQNKVAVPSFHTGLQIMNPNTGTNQHVVLDYSGASRQPSPKYAQLGILKRITNPQGITTEFFYEGNYGAFRDNYKEYDNTKNYLHPVGGLRIKQIEIKDPGTKKTIEKNYKYGLTKPDVAGFNPVWGGGAIKHIVTERDYRTTSKQTFPYLVTIEQGEGRGNHYETTFGEFFWVGDLITYNAMPVSNITFNNGSAVLYNIVSEEIRSKNEKISLKTNYYYNVKSHEFEDVLRWNDDDPAGSVRQFLIEGSSDTKKLVRKYPDHPREPSDDYVTNYNSSNHLYGALIRKEDFMQNKLVASTEYTYKQEFSWDKNIEVEIPIKRLESGMSLEEWTSHFNKKDVLLYGNYYSYSDEPQTTYYLDSKYCKVPEKEITKEYHYVNGRQDVVTTEKKFTYKFDNFYSGSVSNPQIVEIINSDKTRIVDNLAYLDRYPGIISYHKHIVNTHWKESCIMFKYNSILPWIIQTRTSHAPKSYDEITYQNYDRAGNVTEIIGKNGLHTCFLWGYRHQFPIAKIENATYEELLSVFTYTDLEKLAEEARPDNSWEKVEALRSKLPDALVTTYKYAPLKGVVSITDPNNITTGFEYDNYGRLINSHYSPFGISPETPKIMLGKYIYNF